MSKKKILFVMEQLGIGGAEKGLITLLSSLDHSRYSIDLFLFCKEGDFLPLLPREVSILPEAADYAILRKSPVKSLGVFLRQGKLMLFLFNLMYLIKLSFYHFILHKEYIGWKYVSKFFPRLDQHYDVAIGYLEKKTIYFTVDKVMSNQKIGYIHNNYLRIEHDQQLDDAYFNYLTSIVTVSKHCQQVLQQVFPQHYSKIKVIENMIAAKVIKTKADEEIGDIELHADWIILTTVARLTEQKGIANAILVCSQIVKKNKRIKWFIIGEGSERKKLESLIKAWHLEEHFILLGARANPYKYIKMADIYVQPSLFEGYGIAVAEAKALCKPIIASNIPEFQEQIINGQTGLLCDNNESMAAALHHLISNDPLKHKFIRNLKKEKLSAKNQLEKFYEIIC